MHQHPMQAPLTDNVYKRSSGSRVPDPRPRPVSDSLLKTQTNRALVDEMRLPDFIGVGPPRTGTTWLDQGLRGHVGLPGGLKATLFLGLPSDIGLPLY